MQSKLFSRAGLILLVLFAAFFVWLAIDLLLLVFAGTLLAILLHSLATALSERSPLNHGWALLVVILALLGTAVGAGFLFAPQLAEETQELAETLPDAVEELEGQIRDNSFGNWFLDRVLERAARSNSNAADRQSGEKPEKPSAGGKSPQGAGGGQGGEGEKPGLQDAQDAVVDQAAGAAWRIVDGLVALVIVIFTGLYLAANPQPYIRGLLRLFPLHSRHRLGEVLYACGYTLRWWLFGQLMAMTLVGLMMGVGLAIIGVPLAFALGVVAGLFEFIPTLGPLLGLAPALLLALSQGGASALWVLALYTVVQAIEGYLLTPLVQQRVVHLPPVVTILAQVFFAWTVGPVGLLIAVPLIAVVMVIVQMLYVEDFLGDDMEVDAEDQGAIEHAEVAPMEGEDETEDKKED